MWCLSPLWYPSYVYSYRFIAIGTIIRLCISRPIHGINTLGPGQRIDDIFKLIFLCDNFRFWLKCRCNWLKHGPFDNKANIGQVNGLVPRRWQSIIWPLIVPFNDAYLHQSAPNVLKVLALNMSNLIISTQTYTIGSLTTPPAQVAIAI